MSIIEKAVDRLSSEPGRIAAPAAPRPVPEAFGFAEPPQVQADAGGNGADTIAPKKAPPLVSRPHAGEARIDVERLRKLGILTPGEVNSQLAEEVRLIKRPILLKAFGEQSRDGVRPNLVVVTSSLPGEGKTFLSISLALSMAAELDRTVLLVDGDVLGGRVASTLGIQATEGLTDLLTDERRDVASVLLRTDIEKLTLLPAGMPRPNSTELLASDAMQRLADELASRYHDRLVLFDSPPLLATSGASVLVRVAGQIVLVVEAERTSQAAVKESLRLLAGLPVTGLLLNKARRRRWAGYGYGYGYGYKYRYGEGGNAPAEQGST